MGFLPNTTNVTLTAKLTPYGRQQLLTNSDSVITHFSLGDSDANYRASEPLGPGEVPEMSGILGVNGTLSNSVSKGYVIKNKVIVNENGDLQKKIELGSDNVITTEISLGVKNISKIQLDGIYNLDRTDSEGQNNWLHTFGLPITESNMAKYTQVKDAFGGFADTALNGINQDNVLVIAINSDSYGEQIDGKSFKITIEGKGVEYELFATYQKTLTPLAVQDTKTSETSPKVGMIANNVAVLFCDQIARPNNNLGKSWATGHQTQHPFSQNNKELFNLTTNTAANTYADTACGLVYLDKGFVVITNPEIVSAYENDDITLSFETISTEVYQDITCVVNRGEFISSTNDTYSVGDLIRVSEVGLHDALGNLMAVAKINQHIPLGANQFMALGLKITV